MSKLVQSGIPKNFEKQIYENVFKPRLGEEEEKKVFSIEDLKFGFVIYLVACVGAILAFIGEILWKKCRKK